MPQRRSPVTLRDWSMKSLGKVLEPARNEWPLLRSEKTSLAFLLAGCVGAVVIGLLPMGCKKQQPVSKLDETSRHSLPVSAPPGSSDARPSNVPPALAISDSSQIDATLHELSLELRRYVVRTHSVPKSFEEFAAK